MNFEHVIGKVITSTTASMNYLTDGLITCHYHQIPLVFEKLEEYLLTQNIQPATGIALEGLNSVPGALILLYLLKNGYDFVLLPHRDKTLIKPTLPAFCQSSLVVKNLSNYEVETWYHHPANFLEIDSNERYQARPVIPHPHGEAKLYLRTSGSMGTSKIVVFSHQNLFNNALNCTHRFQLQAEDRVFIPIPIFHMYGLGAGFLPTVMVGASLDLQEHSNIIRYLDRERQFNPTAAFLTPLLCEMLVQGRRGTRPYRLVVTAGDKIKEEVFRAFDAKFGGLVNLYGSTEMGAAAACAPSDPIDLRATMAKPMAEVQMRVTSDIEGELEDGLLVGELYCKHEYGFEEYIDEQGQLIAHAEAWFKTGDLAEVLSTGYIRVLGRCDHSVNRSGFLILFSEVEKIMETIESVAKVILVTPSGEEKRGQRLAAFCVPKDGASLSATQVRQACFSILPKHAIPDQILIINSLPTLPSGKLDRQTLVKMADQECPSMPLS